MNLERNVLPVCRELWTAWTWEQTMAPAFYSLWPRVWRPQGKCRLACKLPGLPWPLMQWQLSFATSTTAGGWTHREIWEFCQWLQWILTEGTGQELTVLPIQSQIQPKLNCCADICHQFLLGMGHKCFENPPCLWDLGMIPEPSPSEWPHEPLEVLAWTFPFLCFTWENVRAVWEAKSLFLNSGPDW